MARNAKRQASAKANNKEEKKDSLLNEQASVNSENLVSSEQADISAQATVRGEQADVSAQATVSGEQADSNAQAPVSSEQTDTSAQGPVSSEQTDASAKGPESGESSKTSAGDKQDGSDSKDSVGPKADSGPKVNAGPKAPAANENSGSSKKSQAKGNTSQKAAKKPPKEVLYQVKTKRDSDVIKAYITFTYRVMHPRVTGRLIFFGILIALPAIIAKQMWLKAACIIVGALLILLGLFRQYISLALTKRNDEAYKNGTVFTYDFTLSGAKFYSDNKLTSSISKYKDIISFFYDDDFYYLGIRNKDFFILPKSRFTKGDPAEFEDFIYNRCKKTCKWIPNKFSDRMKLRRASRALKAEASQKQQQ